MEVKRGDLVFVFDPVRPTGSGSGVRGLHMVEVVTEDEATMRPVDRPHQHVRLPLTVIRIVYPAAFVAEEFLS
jgi:hypothetical protein